MLDNFGMGEFLMLALFALLFFGPERLPQIGARLGRWLSQLTQASKVFMNQWTEEAAAIQDAVNEVRGIRDEIRAARAEISDSLDIARQDIAETIDEARGTVREAAVTPQGMLAASAAAESATADTNAPPRLATQEETEQVTRPPSTRSGDQSGALSKTQDVLDGLVAERGLPVADDEAGDNGAEAGASAEDEYERNLKAIEEIMERDAKRAEEKARRAEPAPETESEADEQVTPPVVEPAAESAPEEQAKEEAEEPVQETAFDKTQRVLDGLLGKGGADEPPEAVSELAPEEPTSAPEAVAEGALVETAPAEEASAEEASGEGTLPEEAPAPASDTPTVPAQETEEAIQAAPDASSPDEASGVVTEAVPDVSSSKASGAPPSDGEQGTGGLDQAVSYSQFVELSEQVDRLRRELEAMHQELQALRTASSPAQDGPEAVSVEEAA